MKLDETLCTEYKGGGLKRKNIPKKIISLRCSWVRRLYDGSFHEWKIISLRFIKNAFGHSFRFHSNLALKRHIKSSLAKTRGSILHPFSEFMV